MRKEFYLVALLICSLTFFDKVKSQNVNESDLSTRKINISARQKSFYFILGEFSKQNEISIGVQVTKSEEPKQCRDLIDFNYQSVNISTALDKLILNCPIYTWAIKDKVINVFPKVPEASILDVNLPELKVENKETKEIIDTVFDSPTIKLALNKEGIKRDTTIPFMGGLTFNRKKYSFSLREKDLRQTLNYLITDTENKFWVIYMVTREKDLIGLNIF